MKITVNINDKPVEIELTDDQVAKVKRQNTKATDRIKTLEDACEELDIDPDDITDSDGYGISAFIKLQIICKALNEEWTPDWNNQSQHKYYPYFKADGKGGFSDVGYDDWDSVTNVGSRLCFKSSELAMYAGKQFKSLYNKFLAL